MGTESARRSFLRSFVRSIAIVALLGAQMAFANPPSVVATPIAVHINARQTIVNLRKLGAIAGSGPIRVTVSPNLLDLTNDREFSTNVFQVAAYNPSQS